MNDIVSFLTMLNDPLTLIRTVGYIGLWLIVFAETGLLFGFFLPGDSLLITAGLLGANGNLSVSTLCIALSIAAVLGDSVGFYIGHVMGTVLYKKKDSFFFRRAHLEMAKKFYDENGGKTIIFARFIPIIRTFAPTVAGAAKMPWGKFLCFNVFGGIGWVCGLIGAGYFLGRIFGSQIERFVHILIVFVVLLSVLPLVIKWIRKK